MTRTGAVTVHPFLKKNRANRSLDLRYQFVAGTISSFNQVGVWYGVFPLDKFAYQTAQRRPVIILPPARHFSDGAPKPRLAYNFACISGHRTAKTPLTQLNTREVSVRHFCVVGERGFRFQYLCIHLQFAFK